VNCSEAQKWFGDAIDREIPSSVREEFFVHLRACLPCRNEYELELLGKNIVHSKIQRIPAPAQVHQSVLTSLRQQYENTRETWVARFLGGRILAPVLTASLAILALLVLLTLPKSTAIDEYAHTAPNDIINQSLNNFALVRSGTLKPTMVACYSDVMIGYFHRQDVDFAVSVLSDDSCDWFGAMSNSYGGVKLAHIVYKRGNDLLYVYEVDKDEAMNGSILRLPTAARTALDETGWYTDPKHKDCNVILWTVDKTLCAAVSTMSKDRMLALLTAK
jgi:hypothetical protein